ncbi:hypothetical protein [Xanthomonas melonis]
MFALFGKARARVHSFEYACMRRAALHLVDTASVHVDAQRH